MKQRQQSARLAKLQAGRRAQQLPRPDPAGADESFRKLHGAVQAAKAEGANCKPHAGRTSYILPIVAFCFGAATAIYGIRLFLN